MKLLEYWNHNSLDVLVAHVLDPRFKMAFIDKAQIPIIKQAVRAAIERNDASPSLSATDEATERYLNEFDTLLPRRASPLYDEVDRFFGTQDAHTAPSPCNGGRKCEQSIQHYSRWL